MCIVSLCASTWAWFTTTVPSNNNVIKSAQCLLTVSVADGGEVVTLDEHGNATLTENVDYEVTLTLPKNSSSGYVIIKTSQNSYYTVGLISHKNDEPEIVKFTVKTNTTMQVGFIIHWGIYSGEADVENNGTLILE